MSSSTGRPETKKFKRAVRAYCKERTNRAGKVIVRFYLQDPDRKSGNVLKGNMTRSIAVEDSTVEDVVSAVERALF